VMALLLLGTAADMSTVLQIGYSACSSWPLSCALGGSVGAGPRAVPPSLRVLRPRINGARWLTVTVPLPNLPFDSARPLDATAGIGGLPAPLGPC
jgi:hypothetical protein